MGACLRGWWHLLGWPGQRLGELHLDTFKAVFVERLISPSEVFDLILCRQRSFDQHRFVSTYME